MRVNAFGFIGGAVFGAALAVAPQLAFGEGKKGQDYPNEKCDRHNKDGTDTTGQCSNVCKDLEVSTTKDVNTGHRTCKEKARIVGGWGLVSVTGVRSAQFLRFNEAGDIQACAFTTKADEVECLPVTIREAKSPSAK